MGYHVEALNMAIKALETIPKYKDAYDKGWDDGAKASYEHLKMCEEEQGGDLIQRQAVNDLISKFIIEIHTEGGRDLNAHTNDVLRQILRNVGSDRILPSVNPQEPRWISVSERLPEESGEYLVSVIDEYDGNYEAVGVAWFAHKKDYDIKESEWRELGIDETVIAWMPLPKPYEPQEKQCADCIHYGKLSLDCGRCDDDCSMFEPQESEVSE